MTQGKPIAVITGASRGAGRGIAIALDTVGMLDAGLIGADAASYFAAPMMVEQRNGLIVFTSGSGASHYVFGPVYGVHKAGLDKLAADMAVDFRDFSVAAVSIWMGTLLTERVKLMAETQPERFEKYIETMETPEFTGHIIWALYRDPKLMDVSGRALIGADVAVKYRIKDVDGRQPVSYRELHGAEPFVQYPRIIRYRSAHT